MEQEQLSRYIELEMGENVREMGGYPAEGGALTQAHRFLRSGTTFELTRRDLRFLRRYGVRRVVDLRGVEEAGVRPDPFSKRLGVAFLQEPLYNFDMHDPKLEHPRSEEDDEDDLADFLIRGYLDMLGNKPAFRRIFEFFAQARPQDCILYHCTAGMDRTGVLSMLLLGLVGVDREHIMADYAYSYGDEDAVDELVFGPVGEAAARGEHPELSWADVYQNALLVAPLVMGTVYDRLCTAYDDVPTYLRACGLTDAALDPIRAHLLAP